MGQFRITNTEPLTELLGTITISSTEKAEKVAAAFMKMSCNRNLLHNQHFIHKYVAAAVYRLALYLPVPIEGQKNGRKSFMKYRSRVGDVIHLIMLLSNQPPLVWKWLRSEEVTAAFLDDSIGDINLQIFAPVAANMTRILLEGSLDVLTGNKMAFAVEQWAVSPVACPTRASTLSLEGLTNRAIIVRCSCDIRLFLEGDKVEKPVGLDMIGVRFRNLRNFMNLSQKEMAAQIGITTMAYMRMENGVKISAQTLFMCLQYYSRIINLDVLFDNRIWRLAQQDDELLYKKVHINSVVHRKHQLMKESLTAVIEDMKDKMNNNLNVLLYEFNNGINSVLSLTEE